MSLKDILVHIADGRHCRARLDAAIALAAAHDAHLIGLYVLTRPKIPGYIQAQIPEHVFRDQAQLAEQAAEAAHALGPAGPTGFGARLLDRLVAMRFEAEP